MHGLYQKRSMEAPPAKFASPEVLLVDAGGAVEPSAQMFRLTFVASMMASDGQVDLQERGLERDVCFSGPLGKGGL